MHKCLSVCLLYGDTCKNRLTNVKCITKKCVTKQHIYDETKHIFQTLAKPQSIYVADIMIIVIKNAP